MTTFAEGASSKQYAGEPLVQLRKSQSHGRIGEAATFAKCWMNGIPAYSTGGLRANFSGSDLIVETSDPRRKLWVQVKTGAASKGCVYLTQCAGNDDLQRDKFAADFVVFVNIELKQATAHAHDGSLGFEHLSFYVVPCDEANDIYRMAVVREYDRPKRDGGTRKLNNMAVQMPTSEMERYRDKWACLRLASGVLLESA